MPVKRVKNSSLSSASTVPATYFDLQAYWGVTKHMGGRRATDELFEMCDIGSDSLVLEVGCGVGVTTSILLSSVGCRVAALDRKLMMLSRARDRTRREGGGARAMFVCAEAEHLPFREGVFDVVISESVTTFAPDRAKAVEDYARVTKPGGRVGMNEEIWHEPPTESMKSYVGAVLEIPPDIPDADGWVELYRNAGLTDVISRPQVFRIMSQFSEELGRYRFVDYLLALGRVFSLFMMNRAFRRYLRTGMLRAIPKGLFSHLGYGLFVGVKDEAARRQREEKAGY